MATPAPIMVTLDRPREIRWGPRAQVRLDSLPRRANRPGLYQICALTWAMLVDATGFPEPEDLAEHVCTPDGLERIAAALRQAQEQGRADSEKNESSSTQKPAPASS